MTQRRLLEEAHAAKVARIVRGHVGSGQLRVDVGAGGDRYAYHLCGAFTQMATHTSS